MRSYNFPHIRPLSTVGGDTKGPSRANEVAVLVLDNVLVDPPAPHGSSALLGNDQRGQRVLSHVHKLAELADLIIRIERRELTHVQEALVADVLDRVEIDLKATVRRANLDIAHTRPPCRAARPKELLDRTAPTQGPKNERLRQIPHPATIGRSPRPQGLDDQ